MCSNTGNKINQSPSNWNSNIKYMKIIYLTCLAGLLFGCHSKHQSLGDRNMPPLKILLVDSTTRILSSSIPAGEPIVFIYFQPDCIHCQQETSDLLRHIGEFSNVRLYFITPKYRPMLKEFYKHFNLGEYKNIKVGVDEDMLFYNHFQSTKVPFLAIFNRDKRLVKVHAGTFSITGLIDNIRDEKLNERTF